MTKNAINYTQNPTQCIVAAAFQEHLMKALSLGNDPIGPKNVSLRRSNKSRVKKAITSVIDTGRGRKLEKERPNKEESKEYVLDKQPKPSTLAQRLGLIAGPAPLMSETQWQEVKEKSQRRDDSCQPCAICKDTFGLHQQVILSCSHVFHRTCLEAFERFTGRKSCPLCRKEQYQKRVIYEGAKQHRHHSATIIQSQWRGYIVRSWYKKLRLSVPPKDPILRKKFFQQKLSDITDRLVASCSTPVDVFLREVDSNIAASRHIFDRFNSVYCKLTDEQWSQVQIKAIQRDDQECPICLNRLHASRTTSKTDSVHDKHNTSYTTKDISTANNNNGQNTTETSRIKENVLLSCSHVFHRVCLETFEDLVVDNVKHCPVCRDSYQKLFL